MIKNERFPEKKDYSLSNEAKNKEKPNIISEENNIVRRCFWVTQILTAQTFKIQLLTVSNYIICQISVRAKK